MRFRLNTLQLFALTAAAAQRAVPSCKRVSGVRSSWEISDSRRCCAVIMRSRAETIWLKLVPAAGTPAARIPAPDAASGCPAPLRPPHFSAYAPVSPGSTPAIIAAGTDQHRDNQQQKRTVKQQVDEVGLGTARRANQVELIIVFPSRTEKGPTISTRPYFFSVGDRRYPPNKVADNLHFIAIGPNHATFAGDQ